MSICGNVGSVGWEEVLDLILGAGLEGTLSIYGPKGVVSLYFQGGVVVFPIPRSKGGSKSRKVDAAHANRTLCRALAWQCASFEFEQGKVPSELTLKRSLVLRPRRLREAVRQLKAHWKRSGVTLPNGLRRFPLKGSLDDIGLAALLGNLSLHQRTGTLLVTAGRRKLTVYLQEGTPTSLERNHLPGWMFDLQGEQGRCEARVVDASGWADATFSFLPGQLPAAIYSPPLGVLQIPLRLDRIIEQASAPGLTSDRWRGEGPGALVAGSHRVAAQFS